MTQTTTISVSEKTKELLYVKKKEIEIKLNKTLSWDEFFQEVFGEAEVPKLSEDEAEFLKRIVSEDRKKWRTREFA